MLNARAVGSSELGSSADLQQFVTNKTKIMVRHYNRVQKTLMAPRAAGQRVRLNFAQVPSEDMCDDLLNLMAEQEDDALHDAAANDARCPEEDRTAVPQQPQPRAARRRKEFDVGTLFADDAHLRDFSVTISALKRHVPYAWYLAFCNFCARWGVKGSISLERGNKEEHLHVQVR